MKRIAQINSVYDRGSTGIIVKNLYTQLIDNGFDCKIFFGYGSTSGDNAIRLSSALYVKLNILKTRLFGKHAFYSKLATKKLVRLLKDYKPDLIHIHQIHGHYLNIPILFKFLKEYDARVIITMHDCWIFTGHCVCFDYVNCEKYQTGCQQCPQLKQYPVSLLFDRSKTNYKLKQEYFNLRDFTFIAPSEYVKNCAKSSFIKGQEIIRIYNGVDTEIFHKKNTEALRKKLHVNNGEFIVLAMAVKWFSPVNIKKSMEFIDHARNIKIIIVGATHEQAKGLPDTVIALPYINGREALADVYSLADVFVNLSYEESFSLVNAESLACGTPIITHSGTALPEVVEKCGTILDNTASGLDFLNEVYRYKEKLVVISSDDCINRAKKLFDEKTNNSLTLDLYKKKLTSNEAKL